MAIRVRFHNCTEDPSWVPVQAGSVPAPIPPPPPPPQVLESQKVLHLAGDGSEGDLVGKVVVFYDKTRNTKLACGEVQLRPEA